MSHDTRLREPLASLAPHERRLLELLVARNEIDTARLSAVLAAKAAKRETPLAPILLDGFVAGEVLDRVLAETLGHFHELVETGDDLLSKNPLQAASRYSQALALKPLDAGACVRRALAFLALEDKGQALADLDRAIDLDPRHAPAFHARGAVRARRGELEAGIADLTRATQLRPTEPLYYHLRGTVYHSQGVHLSALLDYARALELDPTRARAWKDRALAHIARGELVPAADSLFRALEHAPATSDVARASASLLKGLLSKGVLPAQTAAQARGRLDRPGEELSVRKRSITVSGVHQRQRLPLARLLLPAGLLAAIAGFLLTLPVVGSHSSRNGARSVGGR